MATALTVQVIAIAGTTPSYAAAAAAGNYFTNDGRTFLQVKNAGGGSDCAVTIDSYVACDQGSTHDVSVTVVKTSGDKMIGPFNPKRFNDSSSYVNVGYDQVTSVTVAAIQFVNTG